MTPGTRLRAIRNLRGLTQGEFGKQLGLQQYTVSALEKDQVALTPKLIDDIHAAFGVRLDGPEVEAAFTVLIGGVK